MVETRNRKRTRTQDEEYHEPSDSNALVEHAEEALEEAKQVRARKNKQRRKESFARNHPPLDMLDDLVLERIFLYLDSPRDVQSLAFCAKYLRACLTPEIIIRSAVFAGGTSRKAIGSIIHSVKNESIHIPSTPRLLRLVNATKCERGDQCFAYNHTTNKSKRIANSGLRPFGLALCADCIVNTSHAVTRREYDLHKRLDTDGQTWRLLTDHYVEAVTGDKAGSIISELQVKQAQATYPRDQVEQALNEICESVDEAADEEAVERGKTLVSIFDNAESKYDAFQNAKAEVRRRRYQEKEKLRAEKRRASAESIYHRLELLVKGHDHEELILDCSWTREGYCHFTNGVVDSELGNLLRAPSTMTIKKLTASVERAKDAVDLLASNGFLHGPNFLSFLSGSRHDYEQVLYRFCRAKYGEDNPLLMNRLYFPGKFSDAMERLREGKPLEFLIHILGTSGLGEAFATSVRGTELLPQDKLRTVAKVVWVRNVRVLADVNTETKYRGMFRECKEEYETLRLNIKDYFEDPATVEFLNGIDGDRHDQRLRRNVLNKVFFLRTDTLAYLQSRNFVGLRNLHRRQYHRGEIPGLLW